MSTSTLGQVFALLVLFEIKHFLADFPLQSRYMLQKGGAGWGFVAPLLTHALVHAALTGIIVLAFAPALWWLALVDLVSHALMDRAKAGPRYLGRFREPNRPAFWICLGIDQMVHHLTGLYIVWRLVVEGSV